MKIDGTSMSSIGSIQATNRVAAVTPKAVIPGQEQDGIKVSGKGQIYQSLLQKVREIPEVREERIREITEQINQGEFKIDAQVIAGKLLDQE